MILFNFQESCIPFVKKKEHIFMKAYDCINKIIISPRILHVMFDFDNSLSSKSNILAYTQINNSNIDYFPINASIFFHLQINKTKNKELYYILIHELFHALGLMKSNYTKWMSFIDKENNIYTGTFSNKCFGKPIPVYFDKKDDGTSNYNHLCGYKDFFSETIHYNINKCSLLLLKDYGYEINEIYIKN